MITNNLWRFIDNNGTFLAKDPHKISRLYFPLANEAGLLCSITPTLHGDIKINQDSFLMPPASTEDLHNSRYNRNFWVYIKEKGAFSLTGGEVNESSVEGGMLWHRLIRVNKHIGLKVEFTNFVPVTSETLEIMLVELTNISKKKLTLSPTVAIPIYARSADRLRDHRHASSLLNRIYIHKYGVIVRPTMVFDERGHSFDTYSYFVLCCDEYGKPPIGAFPTISRFSGEGNSLEEPDAILKNLIPGKKTDNADQGKEAIGAIRFNDIVLLPGENKRYIVCMGITKKEKPDQIFIRFNSRKKIKDALVLNKKFWLEKVGSINFSTQDKDFDRWIKWVMLQPFLRTLFGCSFLPDFDYGRGGRGWRDLWQDCLTLILVNPREARSALISNFGGVRIDGSNATIIDKQQGKFIPDRNNISRVWMDHGIWPFYTLNLYIKQTGDTDILFEKAPYFESKSKDTVLQHILRQHQRPFSKVGKHGNFLLEDADWNDSLDMAKEKGESVAFTAFYAANFIELANLLEKINYNKRIIKDLRLKAKRIQENIQNNDWITVKSGHSFFNGYYDNLSRRVEGDHRKGVRMMLTSQVFPIMSGIATEAQIKEIYKSAKKYLWDKKLKGFRLNTDFRESYPELGRAFSFVYGEKENGSFFSHMNIMFAYALYKRGFVKEGYEVLNSIFRMCINTGLSKIYPGLPEYFNSEGRGMYHYLTGSASWFILTLITQVFGIRGDMGNLLIEPKLVREQFKHSRKISVETHFAERKIRVNYFNPSMFDYGEYRVKKISLNGKALDKMPLERKLFLKLTSKSVQNNIDVLLI